MSSFVSLQKKELLEFSRTGKLLLLSSIFILFGIMNPATAKLTPWLIETLGESLEEGGMTITISEITALDSWLQFFKNIPMALIIFVIAFSGIFTKEYSSGTLILILTKGVSRYKVLLAKLITLFVSWTLGYFVCFGVTYAYNAYYWDNSIAQNLTLSVMMYYIFGVFIIALLLFFSVLFSSGTGVMLGIGGAVMLFYLLGIVPKLKDFLPMSLTGGSAFIYGNCDVEKTLICALITLLASIVLCILSIPIFNKKQL